MSKERGQLRPKISKHQTVIGNITNSDSSNDLRTKLSFRERRAIEKRRLLGRFTKDQELILDKDLLRRRNYLVYAELKHKIDPKSGLRQIKSDIGMHGGSPKIHINDSGFSIIRAYDSGITTDKKEFITNGGLFEEHIARHIVPEMNEENRKALLNYLEQGGRIVYTFDLKPSKHFVELFNRYRSSVHGGADIMAHVMPAAESGVLRREQDHNGNGGNEENKNLKNKEVTLDRLLNEESVRNAIHFTAISPDKNGKVPEEVKKAMVDLNEQVLPYGFNYLMKLVEKKKTTKDFFWALGFSVFGMAFGGGLFAADKLGVANAYGQLHSDMFKTNVETGEKFYKGFEQLASSFVGEGVAVAVNATGASDVESGDSSKRWRKELAETVVEEGKEDKNLKPKTKRGKIKSLLPRIAIMLPGLGIAGLGTFFSVATGALLPFLFIAPTNRILYTYWEIKERARHLKKQGIRDKDKKDTAVRYLQAHEGRFNRKLAKHAEKYPDWALAIKDFSKNQVGVGALLGTIASVPILGAANALFTIPRQIIYAFSGIIFENLAGAVVGFKSAVRSAWKSFERTLSANIKLEKEAEKIVQEKQLGKNNNGINHDINNDNEVARRRKLNKEAIATV